MIKFDHFRPANNLISEFSDNSAGTVTATRPTHFIFVDTSLLVQTKQRICVKKIHTFGICKLKKCTTKNVAINTLQMC